MKKKIAIVAGGDQSELAVSLRSAAGLYSFIDKDKYDLYIVTIVGTDWQVEEDCIKYPIDKNDFTFINSKNQKIGFDFAYITIHGVPGEDGKLQGYFDLLRMPYSCCGVLAAALTFNKFFCNRYLNAFGVPIAKSILLNKEDKINGQEIVNELGLPIFVKPNGGGSSYGTSKVKDIAGIQKAVDAALVESNQVIIESFMQGTEITCGVYKTKDKSVVFPITEVVSKNEFFDTDAKYNGSVEEITPARLSDKVTKEVQALTSKIYDILGAKGIIRVDYIITAGDKINLLEVNTTPGMTATSFIPQQVKAAGLDIKNVMTDIIENELNSK
ncbi:MAG: D-alanine--D-alanine ligase [Paludibacteraceae bacterium]|nr:D-alanine--D-alanine ligase [Paludibacteraceae bacterium]